MRSATRSRKTRSSVAEGRGLVRVDVDLADDLAVEGDRHDDLAARGGEAREVALVRVHVVDELGDAGRGRRAADALADRDADVLGRLGALPRAEDEIVALDEVDPDPGVVLEPLGEQLDGVAEHLVGLRLAVYDSVDRLERAAVGVGARHPRHRGLEVGAFELLDRRAVVVVDRLRAAGRPDRRGRASARRCT